jgi:glycosyltransferase involved in cell wall biosynthesis
MALTDLVQAVAGRRAARRVAGARAVVISTVTAALLGRRHGVPVAVRFDAIAAQNRPGPGGRWQRRRERAVLARADLLLPWSQAAAAAARAATGPAAPPTVVLPPPVAVAGRAAPHSPAALAYAANPEKRGLDLLCEAWRQAAPPGASLGIGGLTREEGRHWLERLGMAEPPGIDWLGAVGRERWLETVAGAKLYVSAARYEDWGMAQMEALAAGVPIATVPTPGPNAALALARELAPALVAARPGAEDLANAIRAGLSLPDGERRRIADRASALMAPYSEEELSRRMAEEVVPRLLTSSS